MNASIAKINNENFEIVNDYNIITGYGINISTIFIIASEQSNAETPSSLGYIEILDESLNIIDKGYITYKNIISNNNYYLYEIKYVGLIKLLDKTVTEKYDGKTLNYIINDLYNKYISEEGFSNSISNVDNFIEYDIIFNKNNLLNILSGFADYFNYIFYINTNEEFVFKPYNYLSLTSFNTDIIHDVELEDNSANFITNYNFQEYTRIGNQITDNELQNMGYTSNYYFTTKDIYQIVELREGHDNTPVNFAIYNEENSTDPTIVFFYNRLQKRIWKNPLSTFVTELDLTINVDYVPIEVIDETYTREENEDYLSANRTRLGSGVLENTYRGRQYKTQEEIDEIAYNILTINEISFKKYKFKTTENIDYFQKAMFSIKPYIFSTTRPVKYILKKKYTRNYYEYELSERYGSNGINNLIINRIEYDKLSNI